MGHHAHRFGHWSVSPSFRLLVSPPSLSPPSWSPMGSSSGLNTKHIDLGARTKCARLRLYPRSKCEYREGKSKGTDSRYQWTSTSKDEGKSIVEILIRSLGYEIQDWKTALGSMGLKEKRIWIRVPLDGIGIRPIDTSNDYDGRLAPIFNKSQYIAI